jgi:soluble lytic murein transglycosylase
MKLSNLGKTMKRLVRWLLLCFVLVLFLYLAVCIAFPIKYYAYIQQYSSEYGLDPAVVCAFINAESRFDNEAVSHKGAKGLMQVMDSTAVWAAEEIPIEDFDTADITNPEVNIRIGCWYLHRLDKQFNGDETLIMAAYNAGSGNVTDWLYDESYSSDGVTLDKIPYDETEKYVNKINFYKKVYRFLIKVNFYE